MAEADVVAGVETPTTSTPHQAQAGDPTTPTPITPMDKYDAGVEA